MQDIFPIAFIGLINIFNIFLIFCNFSYPPSPPFLPTAFHDMNVFSSLSLSLIFGKWSMLLLKLLIVTSVSISTSVQGWRMYNVILFQWRWCKCIWTVSHFPTEPGWDLSKALRKSRPIKSWNISWNVFAILAFSHLMS